MAGNSAEEIVVGANGTIWVAPTDADGPDDIGTAMTSVDGDWTELGFASEDGVTWTDGKTVTAIMVWQSFYAARRIITERESMVAFVLRQWDSDTVVFAFGGGEITGSTGDWTYTPPDPEVIDERSLTVEWQDGDKNYRLYFPRGMVTENVESKLTRAAAADLPITYSAVSDGSMPPFLFFTDDDAFAAASS